ncbi:hypothetical protein F5Y04DRAFT_281349 [Hypomontagnella monticulosa]|nr:hypothetical protein F5Y04DRAFT_281349 [Hypomontagnella monticulosa]
MKLILHTTLLFSLAATHPLSLEDDVNHWIGGKVYTAWELAQFNLAPFNLTDMRISCSKDNKESLLFGCSIQFGWDDPNADQSCACEDHWQWDGVTQAQGPMNNYTNEYLVCKTDKTEVFQFKFVDIFDLSNFSLSLAHMYKDTKNFPTPTRTNMFAQPNITLQLTEKSDTTMTYSSVCDCPIQANITGMTI